MALLNPPDILPEAMRFLVRALLAVPDQELDRTELLSLVAPRGLTEAMDSIATADADPAGLDPDDLKAGGTIIAGASLDGLRTLGLVKQSGERGKGERVKLTGAAADWKTPLDASPDLMGRVLLDAVIQMGNSGVSHGIGDLIQAVVLLHTAGQPLHPFDAFESVAGARGRGFADRQAEALGQDRKDNWPVTNQERWQALRRWAPYLGLARTVGTAGLIPDASEALLRRLPTIPPGDYDVRDFVARCASAVPILDGGALHTGHDPLYEGDHAVLSGGLSISLLQLEADGFLTMDQRSDASGRTLRLRSDGSADRTVTTVIWEKTPVRRGGR
jgi:hypothetical protein